jgi:DNA-binding transcriptional ArsR family regulator
MKYIVIAPMGDHMDALFVGIRQFTTDKIILISPDDKKQEAEKVKEDLEKFRVPCHITYITGSTEIEVWESTFKAISEIRNAEPNTELLVNVATGDRVTRCAATSAAFVNGLKAFAVSGDIAMMLPVMKFSYYKMISDKKMSILKILDEKNCCSSLELLSQKTGMSLPLISYHINGNLKSEGLKTMGLVDTQEEKGRIAIELSSMGRMIVKGYVK